MIKIKGYAIRSTSEEGIYYLVNGWNKHKAFWVEEKHLDKAIFKTLGSARASLTKLLKVMTDYKTDCFEFFAITEDNRLSFIPYCLLDN